jgi:hypothetical protein
VPVGIAVGREAGPDSRRAELFQLIGAEDILQRHQACGLDGLADMGVVEHDEIIACAQIGNRMGLKAFERLLVPLDAEPLPRCYLSGGIAESVKATRMAPGECLIAASHC